MSRSEHKRVMSKLPHLLRKETSWGFLIAGDITKPVAALAKQFIVEKICSSGGRCSAVAVGLHSQERSEANKPDVAEDNPFTESSV